MKTTRHERLVEGGCVPKHMVHIRHIGHVPIIERLVKGVPYNGECVLKQRGHIRHIGHVPIANVAVFFHNALLPSSAVQIILNGASYSCVRQFWREERMHLANFPKHIFREPSF